MTATERYLTPYGLFQDQSFEVYCSKLPEIHFKKEIPQDVLKNFEVIEQLLAHSYYEYRFIDEAYTKALQTFEMAMNIRYNELKGTKQDLDFGALIQRLKKMNQFDTNDEGLKYFRDMRNHYSHPKRHTYAGIMLWNQIPPIISLINEMYEDTDLRLERRRLESAITVMLKNLKLFSHLVIEADNQRIEVYRLQLLFIDNKETPNRYHFSYTPIFNLESLDDMHINVPTLFGIIMTDPVLENDILHWQDADLKDDVQFYSIEKNQESNEKFLDWHLAFQSKKQAFLYDNSIQNNSKNFYSESFREFLKK